jgi:hypothetical protein
MFKTVNVRQEEALIAMEPRDHFKNGVSLKDQMSRVNSISIVLGLFFIGFIFSGCGGTKSKEQSTITETQGVEQSSNIEEQSPVKSNDPIIGYDKVTWGATIPEVQQFYSDIVEKKDENGIKLFSEQLYSDGMQFRRFSFFQDKLYKVAVDYDINLRYPLVDKLTSIYGKFEDSFDYYSKSYNKHLSVVIIVNDSPDPSDCYVSVIYEDPTVKEQIDKMKEDAIKL